MPLFLFSSVSSRTACEVLLILFYLMRECFKRGQARMAHFRHTWQRKHDLCMMDMKTEWENAVRNLS